MRGEVLRAEETDGYAVRGRSEVLWLRTGTRAKGEGAAEVEAQVMRLRLMVEGRGCTSRGGRRLEPTVVLGVRQEGGDAETGAGFEAGAGLVYEGEGVRVQGRIRGLVGQEQGGYEEWGVAGSVRIGPGESGRGWSVRVAPGWGEAESGVERLWSGDDAGGLGPVGGGVEAGGRVEAELGYGVGLARARGVLTPYAGLSLGEGGGARVRGGARWRLGRGATLAVEASRAHVLFRRLFRERLTSLFRRVGVGISHIVPVLADGSVDHGQAMA